MGGLAPKDSPAAPRGGHGGDPLGLVGVLIDGQFRVEELVGEGEHSVVYRGRHEGVDAPVAIKCLNLPVTLDLERYEPLVDCLREGARVHYQLGRRHAHVVQSIACGKTRAPRTGAMAPYMVREWLDGRSLAAELAMHRTERTRSLREVMTLLESAADALAYAHAQGVVHHWVSPSNLFVAWTQEGPVVKVLDFGVAKVLNEHTAITAAGTPEEELDRLEGTGRILRPAYAAPEQLDASFGATSPATDVYAFARIVYEAVTGRALHTDKEKVRDILRTVRAAEPVTAKAMGVVLAPEVEAVLARALATSPRARFADMRTFWDELTRAVSAAPKSILPPPKKAPPPVPSRMRDAPSPPSYNRVSTTAEVAPAVSPPSAPAVPVAPPLGHLPDLAPMRRHANADGLDELTEHDLLTPAGLERSPVADRVARLAAVGWTARQQRLMAAGGAASLAGLVLLLAVTAPRAHDTGRSEPRVATAHAAKLLVEVKVARAPGAAANLHLPADVVPSPPVTATPVKRAPERFSAPGARAALGEAAPDLAACIAPHGPRGPGSVRVRFNPSGKMAEAYLGPPYAGTATGRCILERFSKVRVDPFLGNPASVNYAFYSIPF